MYSFLCSPSCSNDLFDRGWNKIGAIATASDVSAGPDVRVAVGVVKIGNPVLDDAVSVVDASLGLEEVNSLELEDELKLDVDSGIEEVEEIGEEIGGL